MILNSILIVVILAAIVYVVYKYGKSLNNIEDDMTIETEQIEEMDINFLVKEVSNEIARKLKRNINDDHSSRSEIERKRQRVAKLRENLTRSAYGDSNAKTVIKNNIKDFLTQGKYEFDTEEDIETIIPFSKPYNMSGNDRFETVLYAYNKRYGSKGLDELIHEWDLSKPSKGKDGQMYHVITERQIAMIYDCLFEQNKSVRAEKELITSEKMGIISLDFADKLEILAQKIFERYQGLGPVDMLLETSVDEIDCGVSGIPKGSFTMKQKSQDISYSYESVWILFHGVNIHMKCLSFETQQELIRVCDNIYKYDAPYVMSRSQGRVVSTMVDGSRIVVVRPPFADSYAFFLRKFDSAESLKPQELIDDENKAIPIAMIKWFIKGQRNVSITGSQGTGKTTWLKSIIRFIPTEFNIRIQELQAEMNLRYTYTERNIVAFQETANISAQEGLNLQKKTNGAVNIIGEVANAVQASHIIQTAMVASLFALFTHHAKTAAGLVEAISNNLLELGLYKDKKDAVAMTAQVLNIDCHLTNIKGKRYIERITEIIPSANIPYPSIEFAENFAKAKDAAIELDKKDSKVADSLGISKLDYLIWKEEQQLKAFADMPEYFHRTTDPKLYTTKDIVKWYPLLDENGNAIYNEKGLQKGIFKLENLPSDSMMEEIKSKLSIEEEKEFERDLKMMQRISGGESSAETAAWIEEVLAS